MGSLLDHPAVQAAVAPFIAGLIVVAVLHRARLGGLAAIAGFAVAVALISGFGLTPLTATRKIVLLALAAPVVGIALDFAFKAGRAASTVVGLACGALTVWVFWSVLAQKDARTALVLGGGVAAFVAWLVAATVELSGKPVRAGALALGLGLSAGIAAILAASALYGQYGIALGAGAGAFLLWQMVTGRKLAAGATLALPAALTAGLLAAGALVLAQLPWYALAVFALMPLAARLPAPERPWLQAILVSAYVFAVALIVFVLTWRAGGGPG